MGHVPVAKPSPIPRWSFPRRGIAVALVLAGMAMLAAVVFATAYPSNPAPVGTYSSTWQNAMRANDLQTDEPVHIFSLKAWLVKLQSGEILALSHKDPRLGCTVPWRPDFTFMGMKGWFRNPCHSQTYDLTGACFDGPCIRGLDRYETRIVNGDIEVHVGPGTLILGPAVKKNAKPYVARGE